MIFSNKFNMCPECGSSEIKYLKGRKWYCPSCGFDLYNNVAAAVGLVIADRSGMVLFEKRAKEPRKGFLAYPGGFVDPDESAEAAVVRECREETGLIPRQITYLASYPNKYVYKDIVYNTCDLFFTADLPENISDIPELITKLHAQQTEVQCFMAIPVRSASDLECIPFAFESARLALKKWLSNNREDK
jgi:NAD+ diphosphatase